MYKTIFDENRQWILGYDLHFSAETGDILMYRGCNWLKYTTAKEKQLANNQHENTKICPCKYATFTIEIHQKKGKSSHLFARKK